MKKYTLLAVLLFSLIIQKGNAQSTTATSIWAPANYLGYALATPGPLDFATAYPGIGAYQMELTTGGDLNIIGGTKGYQIGGSYMLWNNGDATSLYTGVQAGNGSITGNYNTMTGNGAGYILTSGGRNTFTGALAGFSTMGGTHFYDGSYNTMTGYECGLFNTSGHANNYYGKAAGYGNNGNDNCMYGGHSGNDNQNTDSNVFMGNYCNSHGITGNNNVYSGIYAALLNNGSFNCMIGANAGQSNINTDSNVFMGNYCAFKNIGGNNNVFLGSSAGINTASNVGQSSNMNVFIGGNAAINNVYGNYNITLGYGADAYSITSPPPHVGPIFNAVAIGADAIVNNDNAFILGNNAQNVGIGMSQIFGGPTNRLEISNYSDASGPKPCNAPTVSSTFAASPCSSVTPTGASGLQFRDLTFASIPYPNYSNNFLTVDDLGNVVLMQAPTGGGGTGIGYCNSLTSITGDGGYDLHTHNFYFAGNTSRNLGQNNVVIGNDCSHVPVAKLDVLQNSGATPTSQSSIGIYVENDDLANGSTTPAYPVIGIKSLVPASDNNVVSVAGWFEAPGGSASVTNHAIIVPSGGGLVGIGTTAPIATLEVDGQIYNQGQTTVTNTSAGTSLIANSSITTSSNNVGAIGIASNSNTFNNGVQGMSSGPTGSINIGVYASATGASSSTSNYGVYSVANTYTTDWAGYFDGNTWFQGDINGVGTFLYSDSTIKTKVNSFSNAISIIKKLKPKTYYYDSTNNYKMKFDTFMHYGFIAQQVKRTAPCLVRNIVTPLQFDTGLHVTVPSSTINALDYTQVTPILTEAMQEQQQTIDSLHNTVDSLRTAFKNIQNCLNQLCNGGNAPQHGGSNGNGGNNNSGGTNGSLTNVQDVSLSATNTPLLYQNIPNPFSTSTKINYYLPEGVQGATIVFYDSYGNQMKEVNLSQTGNGTLNISPENLTNGIYSYSLVVNGKVVDTKRMILQK